MPMNKAQADEIEKPSCPRLHADEQNSLRWSSGMRVADQAPGAVIFCGTLRQACSKHFPFFASNNTHLLG